MKPEVKALLKFISNSGEVNKDKLDKSGIIYEARDDNSSNKWASDPKIEVLLKLKYICATGGQANPCFSCTPEGEHYLQKEEHSDRDIKWRVWIAIISAICGYLLSYFQRH